MRAWGGLVGALVCAVSLVHHVGADFNVSTSAYTSALKSGLTESSDAFFPLSFQGDASLIMCGCLYPPCYDKTYNFTCASVSSLHPLPTLHHPPAPFRNSDVTLGGPTERAASDYDTVELWRNGVDFDEDVLFYDPLSTDDASLKDEYGKGVKCRIFATNVTCTTTTTDERVLEVVCPIPTATLDGCNSSTTHPMYDWSFPPCADSRAECRNTTAPLSTDEEAALWWADVYAADDAMQLTYGDFLNLTSSFQTFANSDTSLIQVGCSGTVTHPSGLVEVMTFGFSSKDDALPRTTSYAPPTLSGTVTGHTCWVPPLTTSDLDARRNITVPVLSQGTIAYFDNATLTIERPLDELSRTLQALTSHVLSLDFSARDTLELTDFSLWHFRMLQVGLDPSSLTDLAVAMALYSIEAEDDNGIACYNPLAKLICAPVNESMADSCAGHVEAVSAFVESGGGDTVVASDGASAQAKSTPKAASPMDGVLESASLAAMHEEWAQQYEGTVGMDNGDAPPAYLAGMFQKGDFDEESVASATENEVTRHGCTVGSDAYCMTVGYEGTGAAVVCARGRTYVVCPLQQPGKDHDTITTSLLLANTSSPYVHVDIFNGSTVSESTGEWLGGAGGEGGPTVEVALQCKFRVVVSPPNITEASWGDRLEHLPSFFTSLTTLEVDTSALEAAVAATGVRYFAMLRVQLDTTGGGTVADFSQASVLEDIRAQIAATVGVPASTLAVSVSRQSAASTAINVTCAIAHDISTVGGLGALQGVMDAINTTLLPSSFSSYAPVGSTVATLGVATVVSPGTAWAETLDTPAIPEPYATTPFLDGPTYDTTCSVLLPAQEYATSWAPPLVKNITLLVLGTADAFAAGGEEGGACATLPQWQGVCHDPEAVREAHETYGRQYSISTNPQGTVAEYLQAAATPPTKCNTHYARLTSQNQFRVGSVWHSAPQTIVDGFSTTFKFQRTSPSRVCKTVKDLGTDALKYTHCRDEGGDGFALVLKAMGAESDDALYWTVPEDTGVRSVWTVDGWNNATVQREIVGRDGKGAGYSGLANSLAIEVDTFHNADTAGVAVVTVVRLDIARDAEADSRRMCARTEVWQATRDAVAALARDSQANVDIKFQEALKTETVGSDALWGATDRVKVDTFHPVVHSVPANASHDLAVALNATSFGVERCVVRVRVECDTSLQAHSVRTNIEHPSPYLSLNAAFHASLARSTGTNTTALLTMEECTVESVPPELPIDHVAVHSFGKGVNSADEAARLAAWALPPSEYPNGVGSEHHTVKVEFVTGLQLDAVLRSYSPAPHALDLMTEVGVFQPSQLANEHSPHKPDNKLPQSTHGGQYRTISRDVGMLSVFFDDLEFPVLSVPVDLRNNLDLMDGQALVGFTGATGRRWQEVLVDEWTFCEGADCGQWVPSQDDPCEVSASFKGTRHVRECAFWNTWSMWHKNQSLIMEDWLYRTPAVFSDEEDVPKRPFQDQYGSEVDESLCVGFRRTKQCKYDGERDFERDLNCHTTILPYMAGYCECDNGTMVAAVDCGHLPFTCEVECMTNPCLGFHATTNATGLYSGLRDPVMDISNCTEPIPEALSGYCDCRGGATVRTDRISGFKAANTASFTCADACVDPDSMGLRLSDKPE